MKVAVVVSGFPKLSETFILNQVTGLIDLGHEVDVFAFKQVDAKQIQPDIERYGLSDKVRYFEISEERGKRFVRAMKVIVSNILFHPVEVVKSLSLRKYGGLYYALNNLYILPFFLGRKYDAIHCHFGPIGSRLAFLKDIFPKVKFVTTFHGFGIQRGFEEGNGIYKALFEKSDTVIANSNHTAEMLKKLGCLEEKIVYHPNGIDTERFAFDGSKSKKGYFTITTVARLVKEKDILLALEIIARLKERSTRKFRYYLIGDGYLRKEIEKRISELNIRETVTMFGALPQDEVMKRLKETDVFLLTSESESFGMVLLEAQAAGIPVVATDTGGIKDAFCEGKSGYLLRGRDSEEAVSRIIDLMKNPMLAAKMGKAGKKFVRENFNIRKLNKRLVELCQA